MLVLKNLSFRAKILLLPTLMLVFLVCVGVLAYLQLEVTRRDTVTITQVLKNQAVEADNILQNVLRKQLLVQRYIHKPEERLLDLYEILDYEYEESVWRAEKLTKNDQRKMFLEKSKELNLRFTGLFLISILNNLIAIDDEREEIVNVQAPRIAERLQSIVGTIDVAADPGYVRYAGDALADFMHTWRYLLGYLSTQDATYANLFKRKIHAVKGNLVAMRRVNQDSLHAGLLDDVDDALLVYLDGFDAIEKLVIQNKLFVDEKLMAMANQLSELTKEYQAAAWNDLEVRGTAIENNVATVISRLWLIIGIAALLGGLVSLVLIRSMFKPVQNAMQMMAEIAEGGAGLEGRLDEDGRDELARMGASYNKFICKIQMVVAKVMSAADELNQEASAVAAITQTSAGKVSEQQVRVGEVAVSIDRLSNTLEEIADNAVQAAQATTTVKTNTDSGREVVNEALTAINDLVSEVENVGKVISDLESEGGRIGEILQVINTISEQTNLLALNAAIEAARAGESGRGFAVVADEVRVLSHRIQQETKGIQVRIHELQQGTKKAVAAIERGRHQSKRSVGLASDAGKALEVIADSVGTISTMNSKIAAATETQSQHANTMNSNVLAMRALSEEVDAAMAQAKHSGEAFETMAEQLKTLVQQFAATR